MYEEVCMSEKMCSVFSVFSMYWGLMNGECACEWRLCVCEMVADEHGNDACVVQYLMSSKLHRSMVLLRY